MAAQTISRAFYRVLDTMLLVEQGVTPSGGEDSFVRALGTDSALLGVFDGCGGLGRIGRGLGGRGCGFRCICHLRCRVRLCPGRIQNRIGRRACDTVRFQSVLLLELDQRFLCARSKSTVRTARIVSQFLQSFLQCHHGRSV
jgi:hypothetical protein